MNENFYMVKNIKNSRFYDCHHVHNTLESAQKEADRLARLHKGETFAVLSCVQFYRHKTESEIFVEEFSKKFNLDEKLVKEFIKNNDIEINKKDLF